MGRAVFLIGPPGCGKGTQVEFLKQFGFIAISMSEELRKNKQHLDVMSGPNLVECSVVIRALAERLSEISPNQDVIVDGFPRTVLQATWILEKSGLKAKFIILDASFQVCQERVRNRMEQAKENGTKVRHDDKLEVHAVRMKIHHDRYRPIEKYLVDRAPVGMVEHISAELSPEIISKEIRNILFPKERSVYA